MAFYYPHRHELRDDVYVDGSIVRQDYTVGANESRAILEELREKFPTYGPFGVSRNNLVGRYDGYREPYTNPSISWYGLNTFPSEALQLSFATSYPKSNLKNWYGLKFDLVTEAVQLKVVIREYDGDKPALPVADCFYAVTHFQDGTSSDWIDVYCKASVTTITNFCRDNDLQYPLAQTTHIDADEIIFWGFVFNKNTLEYSVAKGYARYAIPNE